LNENFQIMYGKEASFIDPKNVNEVTKTLNSLFLERNLISWDTKKKKIEEDHQINQM